MTNQNGTGDHSPVSRTTGVPNLERNDDTHKSHNRRKGSKQDDADTWARWQLLATIIRIGIELLDRFFGGGTRWFP
jgi:hypothetical protein